MGKLRKAQSIALAIALALAVAVPVALAQTDSGASKKEGRGQWRQRGAGGHGRMGGAFGNLDLTEAQKAQMKQIRESRGQAVRELASQIRARRQEIRQASQGGSFNEALVAQKLGEIAPLEAKLMGERMRIHQEMLSVLTPEQKSKLEQSREQFRSKRGARRGAKPTT